MNHTNAPAYGLWSLVIINSLVFLIFAFSFTKPQTARDWRSFSAFSAFIVALFAEMYGYPLTIYFLSGWLSSHFPGIDWLAHDSGHLLEEMFGWRSNPHFGPFHIASNIMIVGGFFLLAASWKVLYAAQRAHRLAPPGPYARVRHPQYIGFIAIMFGFLLQWPTIITLAPSARPKTDRPVRTGRRSMARAQAASARDTSSGWSHGRTSHRVTTVWSWSWTRSCRRARQRKLLANG